MKRAAKFSQAVADTILERMAGGESLRAICADKGMPHRATVFRWIEADEAFRARYGLAMDARADALAEEILAIADDGHNDTYVDDKGNRIVDHDHIQRSKLRCDARKWLASKLAPKKYGDRVELAGNLTVRPASTLSDDELAAIASGAALPAPQKAGAHETASKEQRDAAVAAALRADE